MKRFINWDQIFWDICIICAHDIFFKIFSVCYMIHKNINKILFWILLNYGSFKMSWNLNCNIINYLYTLTVWLSLKTHLKFIHAIVAPRKNLFFFACIIFYFYKRYSKTERNQNKLFKLKHLDAMLWIFNIEVRSVLLYFSARSRFLFLKQLKL